MKHNLEELEWCFQVAQKRVKKTIQLGKNYIQIPKESIMFGRLIVLGQFYWLVLIENSLKMEGQLSEKKNIRIVSIVWILQRIE